MRFRFLYLIIFIFSVIIFPFKVSAVSSSSISVNVVPENPAPNENVTITLNSYGSNLDSVLISWIVDGKNALSGIGKKSFSFRAGEAGEATNVTATVFLPDGSIDKRILIRPAVMTLLWQANDSYVPPFYRGKALPTPDSEIKVVAMPEIKSGATLVDPRNMTYAWKKDYTNNVDGSGYGKNSFVYVNDYLEDGNNISVVVSTVDQEHSSQASIDIGTTEPKLVFYKSYPDLGTLWDRALEDGHIINGAEIIEAAPYFISPKDIRIPSLNFVWSINDSQIAVPIFKKNILPLQAQTGTSGTSKIKLEINNIYKIFETANKEINVNF